VLWSSVLCSKDKVLGPFGLVWERDCAATTIEYWSSYIHSRGCIYAKRTIFRQSGTGFAQLLKRVQRSNPQFPSWVPGWSMLSRIMTKVIGFHLTVHLSFEWMLTGLHGTLLVFHSWKLPGLSSWDPHPYLVQALHFSSSWYCSRPNWPCLFGSVPWTRPISMRLQPYTVRSNFPRLRIFPWDYTFRWLRAWVGEMWGHLMCSGRKSRCEYAPILFEIVCFKPGGLQRTGVKAIHVLSPSWTVDGGLICILHIRNVPLILRQTDEESLDLISASYVHSVIWGVLPQVQPGDIREFWLIWRPQLSVVFIY